MLAQADASQQAAFHEHNLAARIEFDEGFLTAAEADLPTIAGVMFTKRAENLPGPLDAVPPIVFSEAIRDPDLVVSVAHAGGVDPEATVSTTRMRAALIRETARLLMLGNISITGDHVLINGSLGEYLLHLQLLYSCRLCERLITGRCRPDRRSGPATRPPGSRTAESARRLG